MRTKGTGNCVSFHQSKLSEALGLRWSLHY